MPSLSRDVKRQGSNAHVLVDDQETLIAVCEDAGNEFCCGRAMVSYRAFCSVVVVALTVTCPALAKPWSLFDAYIPNVAPPDMVFYVPKLDRHSPDGVHPNALLDGPRGLREIAAIDRSTTRPIGVSVRHFPRPVVHGTRLDWCLAPGHDCGPAAAQAFCQMQGFTRVVQAVQEQEVGRYATTLQLGSGFACAGKACNGFARITCTRQ